MSAKPVNKVASYQRLVENINVKLNDAARVNDDAERKMSETLKRLDADVKTQRKQVAEQRERVQDEYRRIADSLASGPYAVANVRIPPAVRAIPSDEDPQTLAAKQHNLAVQIRSSMETYLRQKVREDEVRKRQAEAEARRRQAEAAVAARARAAAAEALARRQALLNQPKPEPSKKKPNAILIIGIIVGAIAVAGIVAAVVLMM